MKNLRLRITKAMQLTIAIMLLLLSTNLHAQYLGSITCFNDKERAGGNIYPYNQSLFLSNTGEAEWWDNIVEEIYHSGIDFSALLCRGYSPGRPSMDTGDPRKIPNMMEAMDRRGLSNEFKLAIFDDCPSGWTANHNYDQGRGYNTDTPFDCRDTTNYKYIWDYNLKIAIENIPDERRFKIDGRMVIAFWQVNDKWMSNMDFGNLKKILAHIRTECQKEFGFNPYLVIQDRWFDFDTHLRAEHVDGVHNWFSSARKITWTLHSRGDLPKIGVLNPGIRYEGQPGFTFNDPRHGQTLIEGLEGTVNSGALFTLCEGFTDAAETAAFWRSKDTTYYDYPNQRIDILRRYSQNAFRDMRIIQAEACDFFHDVTPDNEGGTFRAGDLDICKTTDVLGGWNVFNAEANEWLEWMELPFPKNAQVEIRYASTQEAQIQFVVGEQEGEILSLEPTGGDQVWAFARDNSFNFDQDSTHSVKIKIISGKVSLNYFSIIGAKSSGKVVMSSPENNKRLLQTDSINLIADVIGIADSIKKLEVFYNNEVVVSSVSSTLNTYLTNLPLGDGKIKVTVTNAQGATSSDSCSVFIGENAYTITNSVIGRGNILLDPQGGTYVEGTEVSVYAESEGGSTYFKGWSGDTTSTINPLVLTMNEDINLVATFISPDSSAIRINFQPDDAPVPENYVKDTGLEYGLRYCGLTYGWVGGPHEHTRNRDVGEDIRYATLNHMQKGTDSTWQVEVENGNYMVYLVMGDPSFTDQVNHVSIEGVIRRDTMHIDKFDEFRAVVKVADGNLTISPTRDAENAKICFVEIYLDTINPVDSVTDILFDDAEILSYNFDEQTVDATIDAEAGTIAIEVAEGTDLSALVAAFTISDGATAKIGDTTQESGVTENDFSNDVIYTVVAEDGTEKAWTVTVTVLVGISQPLSELVTIYPNPTSGNVWVAGSYGTETTAIIYDIFGRVVLIKQMLTTKEELELNTLEDGLYFVEIISGAEKAIFKVVKE